MNYDFGDIIDCRKAPINHFILVLGESRNDEIMFYQITSRTYKVFKDILAFFNDCIDENYSRFFNFFGKEKRKQKIMPTGNLCDAFFLDKHSNYSGHLDVDCMILMNSDPELTDKKVIDAWRSGKLAHFSTRLEKNDTEKLIRAIRITPNISPRYREEIGRNYNTWKRANS